MNFTAHKQQEVIAVSVTGNNKLRQVMHLHVSRNHSCFSGNRVPTRTGKTGKTGRHFPVREKSGNFEQTGKVRENHTKYWKTEEISEKIICYFSMIFK